VLFTLLKRLGKSDQAQQDLDKAKILAQQDLENQEAQRKTH
jgi:hypothetical protein